MMADGHDSFVRGTPRDPIAYLDDLNRLPAIRRYKAHSIRLLALGAGARVLDVGCGTGADTCQLARRVGASGKVVGIDCSPAMIDVARQRSASLDLPVEFRVADAHQLDLASDGFDACRADRVLQHTVDPRRVIAEMVRLTQPGGRIVVAEPDWESLLIDASDRGITRRIVQTLADALPHGWIGRQLPRLFQETGLVDLQIVPVTIVFRTFDLADMVFELRQIAERTVPAEQAHSWLAGLQAGSAAGSFFAALTGLMVAGRKPGTT